MNRLALCCIALLVVAGCATTQGVNKEIPMKITQAGDGFLYIDVTLEFASDTSGESGDSSVDPQTSASVYGPSNVEGMQEGITTLIEQWMKMNSENTDNSTSSSGGSVSTPDPTPVPTPVPVPDNPDNVSVEGWDIVEEALCDQELGFFDSEERAAGLPQVVQKKCVFTKRGTEYGKTLLIQWSSGAKLLVKDSSGMEWLQRDPVTGEKDYRKYHPAEPVGDGSMKYVDGTPAEVYAPRGDTSTKASILVQSDAD